MTTLETALDRIDLERLVQYSLRFGVGTLIKRLGRTLESLSAAPTVVEPLRAFPVHTIYLLDPAGPSRGLGVADWLVRDNLRLKEDR